eukprot:CAMPEP_0177612118 /NCGR_PEP_ID=MMETSP0419_2-20121207/20994_1 /TAXON_ID=582737 /ORGANISM="Tetraselmis sp., Strain GSL018" /LENGTH=310 /DNA_ID=CAMNT_0019108173 /DNA_START=245 /DNA_END=1176 /DNA_ORIENTATION=+
MQAQPEEAASKVELVIYGDSITEDLSEFDNALDVYEKEYNTLALGISGDLAENLLYRLQDGEWPSGFKPKFVCILIGVNDIWKAIDKGGRAVSEEISEKVVQDIKQIASYIHSQDCSVQIVLLAVLPLAHEVRNEWPNRYTDAVERTNEGLDKFAEEHSAVHFLDCGDIFLQGYSRSRIDLGAMDDLLHPTERGHKEMAQCVLDRLKLIEQAPVQTTPPPLYPVYVAPRTQSLAEVPSAFWPDWYLGPELWNAIFADEPQKSAVMQVQGNASGTNGTAAQQPQGITSAIFRWWNRFVQAGGNTLLRGNRA